MSNKNNYETITNLRTFFRLVIVFIVWLVAAIVPSNANSFYQTIFVASITALYEYVIIFIDNIYDGARRSTAFMGMCLSMIYLMFSFLGFSKLILLNLDTMMFTLGQNFPYHNAENITWSYYYTIYPMVIFPCLIFIEMFFKKAQSQTTAA